MLTSLIIAFPFTTGPDRSSSAALELHWGTRAYDVRDLSAGASLDLLTKMATTSRDVLQNYGTPSTWRNFPASRRAELSAAFQVLPTIITRFEYGRVGSSDPLAPLGPFLSDLYWGQLVVAGNERQHDALWRASLSTLVDRSQVWELQAKMKGYHPEYSWAWNDHVLDLDNPDRPIAVGAGMLLAERYAQPDIMPGHTLATAAVSFRGSSEWSQVAFDASRDAMERAQIASQAATLASAYGGRAIDALKPTEKVLGPDGPFGRAATAYENAASWAEQALDEWLTLPESVRHEYAWWDHSIKSGFALAVFEREQLRMELIDAGMISEVALVKPTGEDLALARRAFELDTWYKWSLFGLSLELEIELAPTDVNLDEAEKNIQRLAHMADGGARLQRAACDDIVNRPRIYGLNSLSGSLQPELRQLARIYKCKLEPGAHLALGEDMP